MLTKITDILRGIVLSPLLTGLARSIAEAAAMAGILVGIEFVSGGNLPDELQTWGPILLLFLRNLEAVADKIDPAKQSQRDAIREDPGTPGYDL